MSDGCRLLGLALAQPLEQVGDVCELLLEVALILLEALENALRLIPAVADAATTEMSSSVVHVHPLCSS